MEQYESRMVEQWTTEGPQRKGYRQLADWFNVTLLRRAMDQAGLPTLGDEATSKYKRLTGDNEAVSAEVRDVLRSEGLPIDQLVRDFVSYGVIRTHLKDCLGRESNHQPSNWEVRSIDIARKHAHEKITEAVQSLENKGKLDARGDITVQVSVDVKCEETDMKIPLSRALRRNYVSQ